MIDSAERALYEISLRNLSTSETADCEITFSDLLTTYEKLNISEDTALHASIRTVLLRILEISILRDPKVQLVAKRWNALGFKAEELLAERLEHLTGAKPPHKLIKYLVKVIGGSAVQHGRRKVNYSMHLPELFQKVFTRNIKGELRCANCGYHFRKSDLNLERRNIALSENVVLADDCREERKMNKDPWKPLYYENNDRRENLTDLTIDHIVPEEGLGWSSPDNLELLCKFCNSGKLAYRWPLESISLFGAGGLADYPEGRKFTRLKQTISASTFMFNSHKCYNCKKTSFETELTLYQRKPETDQTIRCLTPWNLITVCYDCLPGCKN